MIRFSFFILAILLLRCTPSDVTLQELQAYIQDEDNGLKQSTEANGTRIEITHRPTDMWVYQELEEGNGTPGQIDSLRKKYNAYYYFIVGLSRNNKEALHQTQDMAQYSDMVQTLSFRMPQYVNLTTPKQDTIPVADFMLNRTYGMSSATEVLFVFNKEKAKEAEWIQFNLNEFGLATGNQRFRFLTEDLAQAPNLKFNTTQ